MPCSKTRTPPGGSQWALGAAQAATQCERARMAGPFAFSWTQSAVGALPRYPRNIGSAETDIRKLPIAEAVEFAQARIVTAPCAQEVQDTEQHCRFLWTRD